MNNSTEQYRLGLIVKFFRERGFPARIAGNEVEAVLPFPVTSAEGSPAERMTQTVYVRTIREAADEIRAIGYLSDDN